MKRLLIVLTLIFLCPALFQTMDRMFHLPEMALVLAGGVSGFAVATAMFLGSGDE